MLRWQIVCGVDVLCFRNLPRLRDLSWIGGNGEMIAINARFTDLLEAGKIWQFTSLSCLLALLVRVVILEP